MCVCWCVCVCGSDLGLIHRVSWLKLQHPKPPEFSTSDEAQHSGDGANNVYPPNMIGSGRDEYAAEERESVINPGG